jgi:hypothetical protein
VELHFAANALAHDESTLQYQFRVQIEGSEPRFVATCVIPRTDAAIAIMHQHFGVGSDARIAYQLEPEQGGVTVQNCIGETTSCGLTELVVTAGGCTNPDWTRDDDGVCRSDRGGEGSGTGGTGAGGGDWGGGGSPSDEPLIAPEGIDQADFEQLNPAEKWLCVLNPNECAAVIVGGHEASVWARDQTPELLGAEGDNKRDALRHALWQAILTRLIGSTRAAAWGNAHETSSLNPMSTCMDQWNNAVGRSIGAASGNVYTGVLTAWNNEQLKGAPFSC